MIWIAAQLQSARCSTRWRSATVYTERPVVRMTLRPSEYSCVGTISVFTASGLSGRDGGGRYRPWKRAPIVDTSMPSTTKPMSSLAWRTACSVTGTTRSAMIDMPASTSSLLTLFRRRTTPSTQSDRSD